MTAIRSPDGKVDHLASYQQSVCNDLTNQSATFSVYFLSEQENGFLPKNVLVTAGEYKPTNANRLINTLFHLNAS